MLADYEQEKDALLDEIEALVEVADARGSRERVQSLKDRSEKIRSNKFVIAAFGGFSSGKSTFFNALVSRKLFPSLNTPTTASINYIGYGEKSGVRVSYKSKDEYLKNCAGSDGGKEMEKVTAPFGSNVDMEIDELLDISRENSASFSIRDIMVRYPSGHLKPEDVIWVDTPGTDSVIEHHKQVTYSLINKADAILFFIYAPVPFKESDWRFLQDIREIRKALKTDKFFFIVNAIDAVDDEPDEILNFIRRQLETRAGIMKPQLIPVSSKLALFARMKAQDGLSPAQERGYRRMLLQYTDAPETVTPEKAEEYSNFSELQKLLSNFLQEEKGQVIIRSTSERLLSSMMEIRGDIAMERWGLNNSIEEMDKMINETILPDLRDKEKGISVCLADLHKKLMCVRPDMVTLENSLGKMVEKQAQNEKVRINEIDGLLRRHSIRIQNEMENEMKTLVSSSYSRISGYFNDFNGKMLGGIKVDGASEIAISGKAISSIDTSEFITTQTVDSGGGGGLGILGALIGGIAAVCFPGGLGFFAGAVLGGLAGNEMDKQDSPANRTVNKFFDALGYKKKVMEKLSVSTDRVQKELVKNGKRAAETITDSIRKETEARLDQIRSELKRLSQKRHDADKDRISAEKKLAGQEEALSEQEERITEILRRLP